MNNLINNSDEKVLVKASDLLKKFKTKEDRYNFLREMSKPFFIILDLYFPKEIEFDSNYFLQVLIGAKKVNNILFNSQLLPLGHHNDYNFKYFKKVHILTKDFLTSIINKNQAYAQYIPDNTSIKSLSRDYILSVSYYFIFQLIAFVEPNTYSNLYELYKSKNLEKETKKWNNYKIEVIPEVSEKIQNFIPCQR